MESLKYFLSLFNQGLVKIAITVTKRIINAVYEKSYM